MGAGIYTQFQYAQGEPCVGRSDLDNYKTARQKDGNGAPDQEMSGAAWSYWSCMLYALAITDNLFLISQIYPGAAWAPHNPNMPAVNNNGQDGTIGNGEYVASDNVTDTQGQLQKDEAFQI